MGIEEVPVHPISECGTRKITGVFVCDVALVRQREVIGDPENVAFSISTG